MEATCRGGVASISEIFENYSRRTTCPNPGNIASSGAWDTRRLCPRTVRQPQPE